MTKISTKRYRAYLKGEKDKACMFFACYVSGILFTSAELLLLLEGIVAPSPTLIRSVEKGVSRKLLYLAQATADQALFEMKKKLNRVNRWILDP